MSISQAEDEIFLPEIDMSVCRPNMCHRFFLFVLKKVAYKIFCITYSILCPVFLPLINTVQVLFYLYTILFHIDPARAEAFITSLG